MLTESVHLRLNSAERDAVAHLAATEGRSTSNWIRRVILAELVRERERRQERSSSDLQQRPYAGEKRV